MMEEPRVITFRIEWYPLSGEPKIFQELAASFFFFRDERITVLSVQCKGKVITFSVMKTYRGLVV